MGCNTTQGKSMLPSIAMLTLCGSVLCAQASVVPNDAQSVLDQSTGLVWKEFKSLSEGEA